MRKAIIRGSVILLLLLAAGCVVTLRWLSYRDPAREPMLVDDIAVYGDSLRALPLYENAQEIGSQPPPKYPGPGSGVRWSPDRRFAAVTTDWDDNFHLLPPPRRGTTARSNLDLVTDATCSHTVAVWERDRGVLRPVVTTRESDCLSGTSHKYVWSADSQALLVYGIESTSPGSVRRLCVVYLVHPGQAYRLNRCPKPRSF
jgi:hypothetical protein